MKQKKKIRRIFQLIRRAAREKAKELDLGGYQLESLPPEIGQLTHLTRLDLSGNQLTSLPSAIEQLTNLTYLCLNKNQIKKIPHMIHLLNLDLGDNQLTRLPLGIESIPNLIFLNLRNNKLTSFPSEIEQIKSLSRLDLKNNQLTSLPPEIGRLTNLNYLDISDNKLISLPAEIGQLTNLMRCDIGNNQLTSLPPEIIHLRKMHWINFSPIIQPFMESMAVYEKKWLDIAISTEPGDRTLATKALKTIYQMIGKKEPDIIFFDSPYQVLREIYTQQTTERRNELKSSLSLIDSTIRRELCSPPSILGFNTILNNIPNYELNRILDRQLSIQFNETLYSDIIKPEFWADRASWFDFFTSTGGQYREQRDLYGTLTKNCGWIVPFEEVCWVCDRPRFLSFDSENRLHAEGSPAIQFADGFSVYVYHGIRLPEEYGKFPPSQWQSHWLLSEENAELRRVLIQGIGYDRLCQELQTTELDYWQGYSLLRIDKTVDSEPMHLLKMNCPSTNYIHVLRVPPDIELAREAIKWVNWGIEPQEFLVQS